MMDEMTAWNIFTSTGKVEDYIRFRNIEREEGVQKSVTGEQTATDKYLEADVKYASGGTGSGNYQVL